MVFKFYHWFARVVMAADQALGLTVRPNSVIADGQLDLAGQLQIYDDLPGSPFEECIFECVRDQLIRDDADCEVSWSDR